MAKKASKRSKGQMIAKEGDLNLKVEQILSHPAITEIRERLETVRGMLAGLPEAIGRAVGEALWKSRNGVSGTPVKVLEPERPDDIEIHRDAFTVDGKVYELPKRKNAEKKT